MSAQHLACIMGWPVEHSPSPAMHNAAFEALGLDWTYMRLAVRPGSVDEGVGLLRTLGVDGANVTIPHKESIVPLLDGIEGDAAVFGAVNTIVRDGARLIGHNTDGEGFMRFLRADAAFDPAGKRAVVLGAGGAARAVAVSLARAGAHVTVCARKREQAEVVAALSEGMTVGDWKKPPETDLTVNATPIRSGLPATQPSLAVDLLYARSSNNRFLTNGEKSGARVFDGLGMLVHQAALSFELWTGAPAPIGVMRAAAEKVLATQTP